MRRFPETEQTSVVLEPGRHVITRRRLLQGGVAAGVALSVPMLPLPVLARESEMEVATEGLDVAGGRIAAAPVASTAAAGSEQHVHAFAGRHLQLPVVETDEFRSLGVSWTGGPAGGASVRVRRAGTWSEWMPFHFDASEAPDPSEAQPSDRRTSSPVWIDRADAFEVVVPDGVTDLAVHRVRETERSVITTAEATAGAAPGIYPRSAWGAAPYNGTPVYSDGIRLAIVHHSVTPNGYAPDDVPGMIRGIQSYHQGGRGWNDIAYNFVVDRFGRIWEARAGGVDKAVIGGHTYGCNTGTIGVCYLGTLDGGTAMPAAAVDSITALLSWKFNQVHAVSPGGLTYYAPLSSNSASKYEVGTEVVHPTVVGHQHFSQTSCPGWSPAPDQVRSRLTRKGETAGIASHPDGGAWLVTPEGQAWPHGWVPFYGSMAGEALAKPMISLAPTATGKGYWMLASDGGIFSFGDARFYGSTGAMRLNKPVVGMSTTKSGKGYWLVASDGGIFSFGDAKFHGSTGGMWLAAPVIGMARTPSGNGYWLFASDGGIFCFGDAQFFGSTGGSSIPSPAVGVAAHPDGHGYWLALADGTVHAFNVTNHGRAWQPSNDPIVGIAATHDGGGYWLAARSGKVIALGNAT